MPPTVAVAIPTYNREQVLVDTLKHVLAQDPPVDEILVIDQTPCHEPEVAGFLVENHDNGRLRWIRHAPPSAQGARNRALRETECDIVVIIDDDVTMSKNFIREHIKNYRDPRVVGVAGRTLSSATPPDIEKWEPKKRSSVLFDFLNFRLDGVRRVEGVGNWVTANCSVRRSAMIAIGGFDETYVGYVLDDVDTALRLHATGGLVVYDPLACLFHLMANSGGLGARSSARKPEWIRSFPHHYFYLRHIFPRWQFWIDVPFRNFRRLVITRQNIRRPWQLLWATASYFYAFFRAIFSFPKLMERRTGS